MDPKVPSPPLSLLSSSIPPLVSPRGGVKLATRLWTPPQKNNDKQQDTPTTTPKAIVLIVHGSGWHSGYYGSLATNLVSKHPIWVASYDQPDCGYSDPDPHAPVGCQHVQSLDDFIEEVSAAIEWAQSLVAKKDSIPIYLVGESYGGMLVIATVLFGDPNLVGSALKGVIILGAFLRMAQSTQPPWVVTKILPILARYYPRLKLPATDFSKTFDEAFGDPQWALVARQDPKIQLSPQFTVGAAAVSLTGGEHILQHAKEFPLPLLAIHGRHDCRTQCDAVQELVDKIGTQKAEMMVVETTGHQLLQDQPDVTDEVMDKISSWLKNQLSTSEE